MNAGPFQGFARNGHGPLEGARAQARDFELGIFDGGHIFPDDKISFAGERAVEFPVIVGI
jgi:hypothetical protein